MTSLSTRGGLLNRDSTSNQSLGRSTRVLAVASAGGHFIQLLRLRPAWHGHDVTYVSTNPGYRALIAPSRLFVVRDASRWNGLGLLLQAIQVLFILLRVRPHVVVSTGAAPGYFALRLAKLFGARTIWVDSIANVEELSLSGRRVGPYADLWLTQWPHLAAPGGPRFAGAVMDSSSVPRIAGSAIAHGALDRHALDPRSPEPGIELPSPAAPGTSA
ncbi:MAG TPA: hypothetical protein VNO52_11940 [Methylomirabilota bacterium]|nr:hypothetical protein [Methylomirabilota bacterium]